MALSLSHSVSMGSSLNGFVRFRLEATLMAGMDGYTKARTV